MRTPPEHPIESTTRTWSFSTETEQHALQLGWRFQVNTPGWIVGAAWLESPDDNLAHWCILKSNADEILKVFAWPPSPTGASEGVWEWIRRRLYPGWFLEADTTYQFLVGFCYVAYAYEHSVLGTELDSGSLVIPANDLEGFSASLFQYGEPFSITNTRGEETLYGMDLIFQPK